MEVDGNRIAAGVLVAVHAGLVGEGSGAAGTAGARRLGAQGHRPDARRCDARNRQAVLARVRQDNPMQLAMYQVDAFTDRLFAGNPAAVCPLEAWLPDAAMQAIAAENNL